MILRISAKCSDMCSTMVQDHDGRTYFANMNDYAPSLKGIGGGDYIDLHIDTETGKIIGWDSKEFQAWLEVRE